MVYYLDRIVLILLLWLILLLYRTRELRRITCLMCFTFFVSGAVFYGMALNGSNFGLNPYFYIMVVGMTEIPAYSLTGYVIKKFGRIYPAVITLSSSGFSVLALAFLPKGLFHSSNIGKNIKMIKCSYCLMKIM